MTNRPTFLTSFTVKGVGMRRSVNSYKEQTDLKGFAKKKKRIIMNSRNIFQVGSGKKRGRKPDKMCIGSYESVDDWKKDVKGLAMDILDAVKNDPSLLKNLKSEEKFEILKLPRKLMK